jgi:hypothetical protein
MTQVAEVEPSVRFEAAAEEVSRKVNRAFSRLVGHLPGRISRATELQRLLKIDSKLAWQIFTVAKSDDPISQTRHIPSLVSVRRVTTAAGERGVPAEVLESIHAAVEEFESVGKRYAGDRASFAAMVSSIRNEEDDSKLVALQQRRGVYRLNCQLWGAKIDTSFTHYAYRRDSQDLLSSFLVNVKSGFQLLRTGTNPPVYGTWHYASKDAGEHPAVEESPLDPAALMKYGAPLLPEFCSSPIPQLEKINYTGNWDLHVLKTEQLGKLGAVDLAYGTAQKNVALTPLKDGSRIVFTGNRQRTPAETCVSELVLHRPTLGKLKPRFTTVPSTDGSLAAELARPTTNFPSHETVMEMGPVPEVAPVGDIGRYSEILADAYRRVGWDPSEFDVYRVTIPYPILGTDAVLWAVVDD